MTRLNLYQFNGQICAFIKCKLQTYDTFNMTRVNLDQFSICASLKCKLHSHTKNTAYISMLITAFVRNCQMHIKGTIVAEQIWINSSLPKEHHLATVLAGHTHRSENPPGVFCYTWKILQKFGEFANSMMLFPWSRLCWMICVKNQMTVPYCWCRAVI